MNWFRTAVRIQAKIPDLLTTRSIQIVIFPVNSWQLKTASQGRCRVPAALERAGAGSTISTLAAAISCRYRIAGLSPLSSRRADGFYRLWCWRVCQVRNRVSSSRQARDKLHWDTHRTADHDILTQYLTATAMRRSKTCESRGQAATSGSDDGRGLGTVIEAQKRIPASSVAVSFEDQTKRTAHCMQPAIRERFGSRHRHRLPLIAIHPGATP